MAIRLAMPVGLLLTVLVGAESPGQAPGYWVQRLGHESDTERDKAFRELGRLYLQSAEDTLQALRKGLESGNREVQIGVADYLAWNQDARKALVPALAKALRDSDADVRREVADALSGLGSESIPVFIEAFTAEDDGVAGTAGRTLIRMDGPAVPQLMKLVNHDNPKTRARAMSSLGAIGCPAIEAVPKLIAGLKDDDPAVRAKAAVALENMSRSVLFGESSLKDQLEIERRDPIDMEAAFRKKVDHVRTAVPPALLAALNDPSLDVRLNAFLALGEFPVDYAGKIPDFSEVFRSEHERVNDLSSHLVKVGKPAVPALIKLMGSPEAKVRRKAISALCKIGPDAKDALPNVFAAASDPDRDVRSFAIGILGAFGPTQLGVLEYVQRALKDEDPDVRATACCTLAKFGPAATAALPAVKRALNDEYASVREAAKRAVRRIEGQPEPEPLPLTAEQKERMQIMERRGRMRVYDKLEKAAIPQLVKDLSFSAASRRANAALYLARMGPDAEEAVPALIPLLGDDDFYVRSAVCEALGEIRPKSESAVPDLIKSLADGHWLVRYDAALALGKIRSSASQVVPALAKCIEDPDEDVKGAALGGLDRFGVEAKEAIPALLRLLEAESEPRKDYAVRVLGSIGKGSGEVIKPLVKALQDEDYSVRSAAARSLGQVGAGSQEAIDALRNALNDVDIFVKREAEAALKNLEPK